MIPMEGLKFDICIYKILTGKECFNCGMTRAFLSILHFKFSQAVKYNKNVIVVFPLTMFLYIYTWYKYIIKRKENKYE